MMKVTRSVLRNVLRRSLVLMDNVNIACMTLYWQMSKITWHSKNVFNVVQTFCFWKRLDFRKDAELWNQEDPRFP